MSNSNRGGRPTRKVDPRIKEWATETQCKYIDAVIAEGDAILKANEARQASLKQMLDATPSAKLNRRAAAAPVSATRRRCW